MTIRPLWFLALASVSATMLCDSVAADPFKNYYAGRYDYFIQIPALPVISPQGEFPGDIYSEPGVIAQRKQDCFPSLRAVNDETTLASARIDKEADVAARVHVEGRKGIVSASGDASGNIRVVDEIDLKFGPPVTSSRR